MQKQAFIEIKMPRCVLFFSETELIQLLSLNPVLWEEGIRRGKAFLRARAARGRESKAPGAVQVMSRGVGALQREILDTLDEAKRTLYYYRAGRREENYLNSDTWRWDLPGWVICNRYTVRLADHVYDLRASCRFLLERRGLRWSEGAFQAAFSRAVKGLVRRGLLECPSLVPLAEAEEEPDPCGGTRTLLLEDGLYLWQKRQRRFVVKCYE